MPAKEVVYLAQHILLRLELPFAEAVLQNCALQAVSLLDGMMAPHPSTKQCAMQQACVKGELSTVQALLSEANDIHAQNPEVRLSACRPK